MRQTGILAPVSALPGQYGIGDFGQVAYTFIDTLAKSKVKVWQILPLNPVGYANSPYQPYSSYAGDELYIDIDELVKQGYIDENTIRKRVKKTSEIHYESVRNFKNKYLHLAFEKAKKDNVLQRKIIQFVEEQKWVYAYAVFITFKKENNLKCWLEWPVTQKIWMQHKSELNTKQETQVQYEIFIQYLFYTQWMKLKQYANDLNVAIMGDIPIYVGVDSADVWEHKSCFLLDDSGYPTFVAGVPPDYFSETGQRWGNPLYDWHYLQEHNFDFWIARLAYSNLIYDIVRIDHFRAFDTYWKIPVNCPTAMEGEWVEAPGYALFDEINKRLPTIHIVVEDLGDLRPEVLQLRDHYCLSGMKIVQFALDPNEENEDFTEKSNTIVYTGTHDNQTIAGWYKCLHRNDQKKLANKLKKYPNRSTVERIIHHTMDSSAELVILPIQDILKLDDRARLNTPGTIGSPNWNWKLKDYQRWNERLEYLADLIQETKRTASKS